MLVLPFETDCVSLAPGIDNSYTQLFLGEKRSITVVFIVIDGFLSFSGKYVSDLGKPPHHADLSFYSAD